MEGKITIKPKPKITMSFIKPKISISTIKPSLNIEIENKLIGNITWQ